MIGETILQLLLLQTRGHVSNLGLFANIGYLINENQILSIHGRNDDHKETGGIKHTKQILLKN